MLPTCKRRGGQNLKANHLKDLLDETPFTREDIIHLQDPSDVSVADQLFP